MEKDCQHTPESTVYRRVSDELVVIQLDTGYFYYFNPETEEFLDFFRKPRPLGDYCKAVQLQDPDSNEGEYLKNFCSFLLENKILRKVDPQEHSPIPLSKMSYRKPQFVRKGEKTLDEITFLCP